MVHNTQSAPKAAADSSTARPIIAIVGQTASGKSEIALRLAREFSGEIISADSWTVRQELHIGTAKPTQQEQASVPHHLLDIVGPCEDFTAAVFKKRAQESIADIHGRGKLPLLVGGTGLYIDSVLFDYSFAPPGEAASRRLYNQMTIAELLQIAADRKLDTANIDTRNKRRIIRLLETNGAQPQKQPLRENTLIIGVAMDDQQLQQRIEQRVDAMIAAGLEQEVGELAARYGWDCEGLKGIGYIEWREYFTGERSIAEIRARIIQATKQLAKRQRTWFKRNEHITWCKSYDEARRQVMVFLSGQ